MSNPCRGDCNQGRTCYCGGVDRASDKDSLLVILVAAAVVIACAVVVMAAS